MRFTRSIWLRVACIAPVLFGLIIGVAVILRANRVLHQAQALVRSESQIAFTQRQLPEVTATEVEFFPAAPSFQQVLLFDGHLFLVSHSGLTELDDNGAVRHEFRAGRELPADGVVAVVHNQHHGPVIQITVEVPDDVEFQHATKCDRSRHIDLVAGVSGDRRADHRRVEIHISDESGTRRQCEIGVGRCGSHAERPDRTGRAAAARANNAVGAR